MKANTVKEKKLERKDYNGKHNFKEGKPEEFEAEDIECSSCGIVSSDDSWKEGKRGLWIKELKWFECSQCEKFHCSRCVIDAEFGNDLVGEKNGELKHVEPFIDKGKVCFHCLDGLVDKVDLGRLLKANNVLIKDDKVLELEEDNDKGYSF